MLEWLDWELLGRLEQLVWRFFDRLANVNWSGWPDEKIVALAFVGFIFVCMCLYLLARLIREFAWVLGAAAIVAVIFLIVMAVAQAEAWIRWLFTIFWVFLLVLCFFWLFIGPKGRWEVQERLSRSILNSGLVVWFTGPPTPEWETQKKPIVGPEDAK